MHCRFVLSREKLCYNAAQVNVLSKMDLVEQYGELAFSLDFYLQVGSLPFRPPIAAPAAALLRCIWDLLRACYALLPLLLLPLLQAQGLGHLAEAMEGSFPPKFQKMTEELCEVK